MTKPSVADAERDMPGIPVVWRKAGLVSAGLLLARSACASACPGVDVRVLGSHLQQNGTLLLTVSLALLQSYGFARFASSLPGAVADPGPAFIAETMLVLTTAATLLMLLCERIVAPAHSSEPRADGDERRPSLTTGAMAAIRSSSPDRIDTSAARSSEPSGSSSTPPFPRDAIPRAAADPVARGS